MDHIPVVQGVAVSMLLFSIALSAVTAALSFGNLSITGGTLGKAVVRKAGYTVL